MWNEIKDEYSHHAIILENFFSEQHKFKKNEYNWVV